MHRTAVRTATLLAALCAFAGAPAAVLAAGDGPVAHAARAHTVTLRSMAFHPSRLTIHRGERVTWAWRDGGIAHNVTARAFHSRTQSAGTFSVRFTRRGTFAYRCTIHPGMAGTIVVR